MPWIILTPIISYFIGSIPIAYIFGRLLKGIDIRKFGSGNVGATNAWRVLGKGIGITVLLLDILKGFVTVSFLANLVLPEIKYLSQETLRIIVGVSCICGHNWPVFLQFKGGKGIATTFGVLLGLAIKISGLKVILVLITLTWLIIFIIIRIVSVASVVSGISLPMYMILFKQNRVLTYSSILLSIFIVLRHRSNIKRVFRGEESRLKLRVPFQ